MRATDPLQCHTCRSNVTCRRSRPESHELSSPEHLHFIDCSTATPSSAIQKQAWQANAVESCGGSANAGKQLRFVACSLASQGFSRSRLIWRLSNNSTQRQRPPQVSPMGRVHTLARHNITTEGYPMRAMSNAGAVDSRHTAQD